MRLMRLAALVAACSLIVASAHGTGAAGAASTGPSIPAALASLAAGGQITAADEQQYLSQFQSARRTLKRLAGTRRAQLAAVLANVQAIAAAGQFIPSRLPALFLTLERNRQWWSTEPLLSNGQRVSFPGSQLVWQYYSGQGIEIQWLGTFGKANGYFLSGTQNGKLRALLGEAIPLATARAGGIAWEYLFRFDGGRPPWTSGLSQGTAIQALTRAWSRLGGPTFRTAATQALGIFQVPPPEGVRIDTGAGTHYLQYSYAPTERILNGFIQALAGLYDYAIATNDPLGVQLFTGGDAEARVEVPQYDTGAWSLYDQATESNLSYHELVRDFLRNLCQRTSQHPLTPPPPPPPPAGTPAGGSPAPAPPSSGSSAASGGTAGASSTRQAGPSTNPDAVYCTTAARFTAYLRTPPLLAVITTRLPGGRPGGVRFSLSKVSSVTLSVARATDPVFSTVAHVGRGTRSITWPVPRRAGTYTITLAATDLAGNHATASGSILVMAPPKRHRPPRGKRAR